MIRMENRYGTIEVSQAYFSYLVGNAVSSCYGVAGMVRSGPRQGLRSVLSRRAFADDGVHVRGEGEKLIVDIHISVIYGGIFLLLPRALYTRCATPWKKRPAWRSRRSMSSWTVEAGIMDEARHNIPPYKGVLTV